MFIFSLLTRFSLLFQFLHSNQKLVYFQSFDEFSPQFQILHFKIQVKSLFIFSVLTRFFQKYQNLRKRVDVTDLQFLSSIHVVKPRIMGASLSAHYHVTVIRTIEINVARFARNKKSILRRPVKGTEGAQRSIFAKLTVIL